jgi:alpha-galactosidase
MDYNDPLHPYAGPGRWNDPDMLQVGNGGLTLPEERLHFTMWAMMKSPLLMGNDITNMSPETMAILANQKVIAINQDPLGVQAHSIWSSGADKAQQVWAGPLSGGSFVVALLNRGGSTPKDITVHFKDIPNFPADAGAMVLEDLWCDWNATTAGSFTTSVQPHDVVAFRMSPASNVAGGRIEMSS